MIQRIKLLFVALAMSQALTGCYLTTVAPEPAYPDPSLPPATQYGAGTLGFYANGTPWAAQHPQMLRPVAASVGADDFLFVWGYNNQPGCCSQYFQLAIDQFDGEGSYPLRTVVDGSGNVFAGALLEDYHNGQHYTQENSRHIGTLEITYYDPHAQIVSGWFSVRVYDANGALLHIERGRFDARFDYEAYNKTSRTQLQQSKR